MDPGRLKGSSATSAAPDDIKRPEDIKIWQTVPFLCTGGKQHFLHTPTFFSDGLCLYLDSSSPAETRIAHQGDISDYPCCGNKRHAEAGVQELLISCISEHQTQGNNPSRAIEGLRNTTLKCNHILPELFCLVASPYFLHLILCSIPWILADFSLLNTFWRRRFELLSHNCIYNYPAVLTK